MRLKLMVANLYKKSSARKSVFPKFSKFRFHAFPKKKDCSFDILILVDFPAAGQGSSTLATQVLAVNSIAAITNMTFANTLAWQIAANARN